jgi:hypothetical protein
MFRLTLAAVAASLVLPVAAMSATGKPICHWTHYKRGNVTYYVQHCTVPRHITKHHATKWNKAGPGGYNTVTPRIG